MNTNENVAPIITRQRVADNQRVNHTAKIFGHNFPLRLEPFVYGITNQICPEYHGGFWDFWELSNGAFMMSPSVGAADAGKLFSVSCENGFEGMLSADALGIVACLYSYSNLSFGEDAFAEICAVQYHLIREYMFGHVEVKSILRAID
jgi:hypothetical protein